MELYLHLPICRRGVYMDKFSLCLRHSGMVRPQDAGAGDDGVARTKFDFGHRQAG